MAGHTLTLFSQSSEYLCWEAAARMMWHWRNRRSSTADRDAGYRRAAGDYLRMNQGLVENEMDVFYRQLGMFSVRRPTGTQLRRLLRTSPVIFTSMSRASGHAMVAAEFIARRSIYRIANPCAVEAVTFEDDGEAAAACSVSLVELAASRLERSLGTFIWAWGR